MTYSKIYLTGMPGSGKTTLGKALSKKLNLAFLDLDQTIEQKEEISINDIFKNHGEEYFRKLESRHLKDVSNDFDRFILATGGGTPCYFDNMEFINQNGLSIYLKISASELLRRLQKETAHRPLLKDKSEGNLRRELKNRLKFREPFYCKSQIILASDNITLEDVIQALKEKS